MLFFIIIFLFIIFNSVEIAPENKFQRDYLSIQKTNAIKGIFTVLILFSHYSQYVLLSGIYDESYLVLQKHMHQMVVVMFFFYSGFGMMESISKKGYDYVKSIATKRLPRVFINFDLAVVLFLVLGIAFGKKYTLSTVFEALIGWSSVGNSNWYMFVIFAVYLLVFVAFLHLKWKDNKVALYGGTALTTALSLVFVYCMMRIGRPTRYYNTMILFSVGMWYSLVKNRIEEFVMKNDVIYTMCSVIVTGVYCVAFRNRWEYGIEGYTIWAIAFVLLVIMITMKISFCNPVLVWFGNHVFSVFILQRLPMIVLKEIGFGRNHKYMFLIITILVTILLAMLFDYLTGKMWEKIQNKKVR